MKQDKQTPNPQLFRLRTPLLKKGRSHTILSKTDLMSVAIKCYSEGGENVLHTHPTEDHVFVILQGAARFYDSSGKIATLTRNQGILAPKGWFYRFEACGEGPLILLRFGASRDKDAAQARIAPDGHSIPGSSRENKHEDPVAIDGAFYE
jgi:mannose-6-phosphate isomerase-like protein (cupin superfamily)